ncbi:MAG TPA: TRAP transporter substrate-binding protein [Conexibacter sp.]|jgi:TRAP-type C4-dicarboxylate transport system substrate-binding protein
MDVKALPALRRTRAAKAAAAVLAAGLITTAAAGCGSSSATGASNGGSSGGSFSLKLSGDLPPDSSGGKTEAYFAQQVEKLTGGHVTVKVFPLSQLGTEDKILTDIKTGSLDFADLNTSSITGQIPSLGLYSLPFLIRSEEGAQALYSSPLSREMLDSLSSDGVQGLQIISNGPFEVLAKKAINTPVDFSGMKLRVVTDPISTAMIKKFNANAVPLPSLQVYSGLQQGVIDGAISAPAGFLQLKWYEVARTLNDLDQQWDTQVLLASPQTMRRLPAQYRDAVVRASEMARDYDNSIATRTEAGFEAQLKARGVTVVRPDKTPFRTEAETLYPQFESSIGADRIKQAQQIESAY